MAAGGWVGQGVRLCSHTHIHTVCTNDILVSRSEHDNGPTKARPTLTSATASTCTHMHTRRIQAHTYKQAPFNTPPNLSLLASPAGARPPCAAPPPGSHAASTRTEPPNRPFAFLAQSVNTH